jgi:outer membrane protein assembly factor BamB/tetratricopeptide (TPR) repeat protein
MTPSRHLLAALALVCLALPSRAEPAPVAVALADTGRLTLPTDPKAKRKLQAVEDYVQSEDWQAVARSIQELLDLPQDVFAQRTVKGPDGKPVETLVAVRAAADRLLAGLPDKGRAAYAAMYDEKAAELLARARKESDRRLLAEVSRRYLYTKAGPEAAEQLATELLKDGDLTVAVAMFDRLVQRVGLDKLGPLTLYQAARAFHHGGTREDRENEEKVWKQLRAKVPGGLRIDGRDRNLKELEDDLRKQAKAPPSKVVGWPMAGGTPSRDGQGRGGTPFLQAEWRATLFGPDSNQVKDWIYAGPSSAVKRLENVGQPIIPAAVPVAVAIRDPRDATKQKLVLVYRCYDSVHTSEVRAGKLQWVSPSLWSLEKMLRDPQKQQSVTTWVTQFKDQFNKPGVLLENSTIGTMSADAGRVYFIDDLAVPPPSQQQFDPRFGGFPNPGAGQAAFPPAIDAGVRGNRLMCVDISGGKLLWQLPETPPPDEATPPNFKHDFRDSYFPGPPLCLGGKLYFLNEKNQEIRLVCFDPGKLPARPTEKDKDDAVVWVQPLGTAKEKMLADYGRRLNAAHIAYGEGILVCPTNAGVLLGVDLLTHSLVWAHAYGDAPAAPAVPAVPARARVLPGNMQPGRPTSGDWKASPPVIAEGKVVFTAPDGPDLKCLNLRNGAEVWKVKRGDNDVYLGGVYAGRVVVVGKKDVRALGLDDGRELWRLPTGMPSGRGVASDNVYYLPLKEAMFSDKEKGPGIFAIDVEKGRIVARTRSKGERNARPEAPGNLVFFDGHLIAQSATEVVAYPLLKVKLEQMNELLRKNANDPVGLFERGELRLDAGDPAGAVADLHAALKNNPPAEVKPRAEAALFDAMTELLQRDFGNGEKYLDEYRRLCTVAPANPAQAAEAAKETQRRRANLLYLLARGRESQGKLGEALDNYLEFGSLPAAQDELLSVLDEPAVRVRPDVWARGRIKALMERATPDQRKVLEKAIADKWADVKEGRDVEKLRHFVTLFGSATADGKEGRLLLAERLAERAGKADLIDAELQLQKLADDRDPAVAARALDGLARLYTRKGLLKDAYRYYRLLKMRFPDTPVRDGRTGAQLFEDIATDKRFLPYVGDPDLVMGRPRFKVTEELGRNFPQQPQSMLFTFEPLSEPLPSLNDYRVAVNYNTNQLKLVDRRTGAEEMSEPLQEHFQLFLNSLASGGIFPKSPRFGYQSVGHLIVVNLGLYLAAIDTVNHKVLWQKGLLGTQGTGGGQPYLNPDGWGLELLFPPNDRQPIAQGGPVEANYVCLQTRDGLMALDPLTGKTLWTRGDVPLRCRLFGDDRHVYLVELDPSGMPSSTRAFRAQDGSSVPVPNFAALYQKRQRAVGRELLVADTNPSGVTLRLYDVQTGKDLWAQTFEPGSVVLRSEGPDLTGVVAPNGRVTVVDLRLRKVMLSAIVDPAHVKNVQQAHLLADAQSVYVAFHVANPNAPWGVMTNLQPNTGLRGITVSGFMYVFDRRTGKIRWRNEVENEQLVLEQWKDMPVLLFTARYHPATGASGGPRGQGMQLVGIEVFDKATGKRLYGQPATDRPTMSGNQYQQIYAINNDVSTGKIEMVAPNYKITIAREDGQKP